MLDVDVLLRRERIQSGLSYLRTALSFVAAFAFASHAFAANTDDAVSVDVNDAASRANAAFFVAVFAVDNDADAAFAAAANVEAVVVVVFEVMGVG